jgi:flagellar M-ring protein FliF
MDQVTSARESYDKQGALRAETSQLSQQSGGGAGAAVGVPGTLSNTPPPVTQPSPERPAHLPPPHRCPGAAGAPAAPGPRRHPPHAIRQHESSASKTYELGREVAVSNQGPGKVKRLSVAVALSQKAMAKAKQTDIDQIKQLVSAAVGADHRAAIRWPSWCAALTRPSSRQDPFYEAPWFATVLHYTMALVGLLMVLMLAVRPLISALKNNKAPAALDDGGSALAPAAPGTPTNACRAGRRGSARACAPCARDQRLHDARPRHDPRRHRCRNADPPCRARATDRQ